MLCMLNICEVETKHWTVKIEISRAMLDDVCVYTGKLFRNYVHQTSHLTINKEKSVGIINTLPTHLLSLIIQLIRYTFYLHITADYCDAKLCVTK